MLESIDLIAVLTVVRIVVTVLTIYVCAMIYKIVDTKGIALLLAGQIINILIRLGILFKLIPNTVLIYDILGAAVTILSLVGFWAIYKELKKNLKV